MTKDYVAGLFDGEGCIRLQRHSRIGNYSLHVTLTNVHKPVLDELQRRYDGRVSRKDSRSHVYQWTLTCKNAAWFIRDIGPRLIIKRDQYEVAVRYLNLRDENPYIRVGSPTHRTFSKMFRELKRLKRPWLEAA